MAILRPLKYIHLKLQFSTWRNEWQTDIASSWNRHFAFIQWTLYHYTFVHRADKNVHALIHECPNNLLRKTFSNALRLMSFCAALSHTRTQPYALTYILHFILWTLQVLRDGQYSTQPLEWIIHGPETNLCRLMTELQPGESPGYLRPCGKNITNETVFIIENCPSDWTDHEVAHKCQAYAFYSELNVSNKALFIQFTS